MSCSARISVPNSAGVLATTSSASLAVAGEPVKPGEQRSLEEQFRNPPAEARPRVWWHWMNGNVSREGITKDLEAMKRVGLGGFQAFHVTDGIPAGPVGYMSDRWLELMEHTMKRSASGPGRECSASLSPGTPAFSTA